MSQFAAHPAPQGSPTRTPRRTWGLVLAALILLWVLALFGGPALMAGLGINLNAHGHTSLYAHGHPFIDARTLWGVPNAIDVLSNIPLMLAGVVGLFALRGKWAPSASHHAMAVFFAGLLLAGVGSSWYHWAPDAWGLVIDRLGVAVTFAGAIALALAERVSQRAGQLSLLTVLVAAAASATLPYTHGNVMPWAVVQFGGMALIVWAATQARLTGAVGVNLGVLIGIYALAKLCEVSDAALFHFSGEWVSGHSLKHGVAALAAWPVIVALMRQNAQAPRPPIGRSIAL